MRSNTRSALERLVEFLSDNSLAAGVGAGLYDAINQRPGFKPSSGAGQAIRALLSDTETRGTLQNDDLTEGSDADSGAEFDSAFIKEALRDPLSQVSQQFLAPQGVHYTYTQLKTLMETTTESAVDAVISARIAGEDTSAIEAAAEQATPEDEDSGDAAADVTNKTENVALESLKGGFYVVGHSKWLEQNPIIGTYGDNIRSTDNEVSPSRGAPAFTYCGFVDPMQPFARKEAALAAASATLIPTIEWSRAVPYFDMKILGPATEVPILGDDPEVAAGQKLRSELSLDEFFAGSVGGIGGVETRMVDMPVSSSNSNRLAGMEAFTMPQSIIPTGKSPGAYEESTFSSVDSTRPFMTVRDFSATVTPTRGTGSSMRATLSLVVHDRGRLPQVASLLKPATLNQYAFDIEWGWSHPAGSPLSENVYGQFINTLRTRQLFSLYQTSYNFTPDGQVEIKCELVTKGVNAMNEIDCGTATVVPASSALYSAKEAVKKAAKAVGASTSGTGIADNSPVQALETLGPDSIGSLIDGSVKAKLDDFLAQTGEPDLEALGHLVDDLVAALNGAIAVAKDNISTKMQALTTNSYTSYEVYTKAAVDSSAGLANNYLIGDAVAKGAWNPGSGYLPLGAIIEAFVVQPLMTTGQYDEIQMVTYTANLNAAAAAGANLGALPIHVANTGGPSLTKMLEDQVTQYGGQYPISRFIRFLSQNFVENQAAPMYSVVAGGLSTMTVDGATGNLVPKKADKNLPKKVKQALLPIYYDSSKLGTPDEPRPTPFSPIKLRLIFDVAPALPLDSIDDPAFEDPTTIDKPPRQVLRIHVVDEVAGSSSSQGWMQILKQARSPAAPGILLPPVPRQPPAGMSEAAMLYSNLKNNLLSCAQICEWLDSEGILTPVVDADSPVGENLAKIEELTKSIAEAESSLEKNPGLTSEDKAKLEQDIANFSQELSAAQENRPLALPYKLNSAGTSVIDLVSQAAPNLVWGREGSIATSITVKQKADSGASTTYMMRALRGAEAGKTNPSRGLPMRVLAADVGVEMFGNPLVKYMQQFFINTSSGTTIDNLYAVIGIEHKISKTEYKTSVSLAPQEAYGIFESLTDETNKAMAAIEQLKAVKKQQILNANVRAARAQLRDSESKLERSEESLNTIMLMFNQMSSLVWDSACILPRGAINSAAYNASRYHGWTCVHENRPIQIFDSWCRGVLGPQRDTAWWKELYSISLGAGQLVQFNCFLWEVCNIYARRINGLINGTTGAGASLHTAIKNAGEPYYPASNDGARRQVLITIDAFLRAGALPYWGTLGDKGNLPAYIAPPSRWGSVASKFATRLYSTRSGYTPLSLQFFMTGRYDSVDETPFSSTPMNTPWFAGGPPVEGGKLWYKTPDAAPRNNRVGWLGNNSLVYPHAAVNSISELRPFSLKTWGKSIDIQYTLALEPTRAASAGESWVRLLELQGDVEEAKKQLAALGVLRRAT